MTNEEIHKLLEESISGAVVEEVKDQPGEDVTVFKIETPFFNFKIDQQVSITAFYKADENLLQFSDRGIYSFCIEDRSTISLKRHRNFIRASGHLIMTNESEEGAFVVNSPTIALIEKDVNLPMLLGHYLSLLLFCGEV